jgi:hypothetical protein
VPDEVQHVPAAVAHLGLQVPPGLPGHPVELDPARFYQRRQCRSHPLPLGRRRQLRQVTGQRSHAEQPQRAVHPQRPDAYGRHRAAHQGRAQPYVLILFAIEQELPWQPGKLRRSYLQRYPQRLSGQVSLTAAGREHPPLRATERRIEQRGAEVPYQPLLPRRRLPAPSGRRRDHRVGHPRGQQLKLLRRQAERARDFAAVGPAQHHLVTGCGATADLHPEIHCIHRPPPSGKDKQPVAPDHHPEAGQYLENRQSGKT